MLYTVYSTPVCGCSLIRNSEEHSDPDEGDTFNEERVAGIVLINRQSLSS
jgi:hypothetical protein